MNISNETSNYLIYPVKTSIYLIDLVCSSTCSYMITRTVQENVILKEDFKYFLLCQYLICTSLYFTLGTLTNSFHLFHINSPRVICWILFAVQITFAQSIMLTLTLLAFNTCIAIYWPLSYKSFVSLAKRKIIAIFWVLSMFNPFWLSIYESWGISLSYVTAKDDTCPNAMDGTVSRIAGMVFILLCFLLIVFSYGLIYREGKRAGHFNSSNCRARKTILIIGVQLSLFIVPVLITLALAKEDHTTFYLLNVSVFSVAQCLSPVVYGLRYKELRNKLIATWFFCCTSKNSDVSQLSGSIASRDASVSQSIQVCNL
ncbi:odorant receptor 131-2 [Callorhinchus milii]|uniref:odorant receptor 131-2 n=1 Tax=Callorhinchus milii TaxID=7868 RepID=UPI0004572C55|nr:odorant receptor 131-2 [Callorhinchus milii]XP_007892935.1 odorant receptor 131-2 [Callorhinchus milii]XP_007893014.1 odorant receptor 131-2 [Callorhinchus milii]|eukprot:gi/632933915/ref/XP_007892916.1/ PREDICTED: uncharacterized protein LOC103179406 [Callorhinchus milii]